MEKITRKEAAQKGLKTYFTGEACKHGHISYRYVKSGACSDCVKTSNGAGVYPNAAERQAAKEQMLTVKVRGFMEDREALAAAAYGLALMRCPVLLQGDVDPRTLPQGKEPSGTALFNFRCFHEDVDALRQIANGMLSAHKFDVEAARNAAFKEAAKWA